MCITCGQKLKTGGASDLSNSLNHIIRFHPELAAWDDLDRYAACIIIRNYKSTLEQRFEAKCNEVTPVRPNALVFPVGGTSALKRQKTIDTKIPDGVRPWAGVDTVHGE